MKRIRVIIVEDHLLLRAGIRALLEVRPGISVVAETGEGRASLSLVDEHRPDVVLMDVSLPGGMNGWEATALIRDKFPKIPVIILSSHDGPRYVREALRVGAAGFLVKDSHIDLRGAVESAAKGEACFSPRITQWLSKSTVINGSQSQFLDHLSPRQREILRLIAEGRSTKEIAHDLSISVKTAETHRTELMKRLDIHDVAGLVRYAIRTGLVN